MKNHLLYSLLLLLVASCNTPEATEPEVLFEIPANFPKPLYNFEANPITNDGFALGKALFYDPILSRDGTISCGECHTQPSGFTHHGHDLSHGIDNRKGTRNSLPVQNLAWESEFFWDGGVFDLDRVPIVPIENPVEMDEKGTNVIEKLRKSPHYPAMFERAYGSEEITSAKFVKALSQFMLTLVSADSRYDKFVRHEGETLTPDELAGLTIFKQNCASCHAGELFTDRSYRNNGIAIQGDDPGRSAITAYETDRNKFRVPSLRNVAVTGPYMHDGRFYTLDAVLDHYAEGVQDTPNLDPLLNQTGKRSIVLSTDERRQVVAFLKTLTDDTFLRNRKFSED